MLPFRFHYYGEVVTVTPGTIVFHWASDRWFLRAYDEGHHKLRSFELADITEFGTGPA